MRTCIARRHHKHSFERIGKWKHFVEFFICWNHTGGEGGYAYIIIHSQEAEAAA